MGYSGLTKMFVPRPCLLLLVWAMPSLAATFGIPVPHTGLADIVLDETRNPHRIYAPDAVSGIVAVFTMQSNGTPGLTANVTVDALPVSAAMSPSGQYLYVACYTASVVDIIDLT